MKSGSSNAGLWAAPAMSDCNIYFIVMKATILPEAKLWEYFCVDVDAIVTEFRKKIYQVKFLGKQRQSANKESNIIQDPEYCRYKCATQIQCCTTLLAQLLCVMC